jgi:hypothetical protein
VETHTEEKEKGGKKIKARIIDNWGLRITEKEIAGVKQEKGKKAK